MASNVSYISTYIGETSAITLDQLESSLAVDVAMQLLLEMKKTNLHLLSLTEEEILDQDTD